MTTTITKEERERIRSTAASVGFPTLDARLLDALESTEHGLRYLSTLVLGHSEGTAEEIGWAYEVAKAKADVSGGEACRENRAEGRGPCGACAICCAEERAKREAAERALVVSVPRAEHDVINAQLGEALAAASEERARRQAAEAREAVLRSFLRDLIDTKKLVNIRFEDGDTNDVYAMADAALSSDGSEMLARVRAAEKLCAIRDRQILLATDREAALTERLRDLESENADLKAEVGRLTSDLAKANQLLMRATDTIGVLRGVRPVDPEMTQEEALADLDAVAARIRAHLDGKGGGR